MPDAQTRKLTEQVRSLLKANEDLDERQERDISDFKKRIGKAEKRIKAVEETLGEMDVRIKALEAVGAPKPKTPDIK